MTEEETDTLTALSRPRSEPASRVSRAATLLAYRENPSFFAVARRLGAHHQTVQRCVERAVAYGAPAALDDRPRPGKEPVITPEAKAWLVSLACDKAKEHGYPHELWTTRLLARHARERGPEAGHECLANADLRALQDVAGGYTAEHDEFRMAIRQGSLIAYLEGGETATRMSGGRPGSICSSASDVSSTTA